MLLPWLIGQIFVRTGAGAMTIVLLIDIAAIVLVLLLFASQRIITPVEPVLKAE
jgi:hypothetical protein